MLFASMFCCANWPGLFCVFFFKQKPAYDMRISDWSSDVCSSDLVGHRHEREEREVLEDQRGRPLVRPDAAHVAPADAHGALGGLEEAGDGAQDRRLAAARGAEEAEELAVFDLEICVLNRRELAEANRDVIELYVGAHIRSVPICNAAAARWRGHSLRYRASWRAPIPYNYADGKRAPAARPGPVPQSALPLRQRRTCRCIRRGSRCTRAPTAATTTGGLARRPDRLRRRPSWRPAQGSSRRPSTPGCSRSRWR